jgi:uncharacterized metal-binding protein YceD (DUF177 family)
MGNSKEFIIPFVGLPLGKHSYHYDIDDSFFEKVNYSELQKGSVKVDLLLTKQSAMMILDFTISGNIHVPCDRCNEEFDLPIKGNYQLIIKIGGNSSNDDDDIMYISNNESEINITQHVYEYIVLSVPIKKVHPDNAKGKSTCNKKVIKNLEKYSVKNDSKSVDPRWEKLINLKLN